MSSNTNMTQKDKFSSSIPLNVIQAPYEF